MKILIIQTAFIGDVVLATPLIEALSLKYPKAQIHFLLRKGNENLLESEPAIQKVIIWNKKEGKHLGLISILKQIRKEKYDLLINLQRFGATGILTWLSGAGQKVGFEKNPFSFSYTTKIKHQIGDGTHEVERNLRLIDFNAKLKPRLFLSKKDLDRVSHLKGKPYIVLAPTSVWFTKQFPKEKWIEFLKDLKFDGGIYFIGGASDHLACEEIIEATGKGENLCGELSLLESAALMKDAKMNYVNDSAPMHFASAVNAPTCAIFCSTIPEFGFGPLADKSVVVQTDKKLSCRPCGLHGKRSCPEGHFKCAREINVQQLTRLVEP